MDRPFFNSPIAELERQFAARPGDTAFLETLEAELVHRKTDRGRALAVQVGASLAYLAASMRRDQAPAPVVLASTASLTADSGPATAPKTGARPGLDARAPLETTPFPPVTNAPAGILSAWTALEVLSPPGFRRPEKLAGGDKGAVVKLDGPLPWERGGKAKPGTRLYYQVVLGSIDMPEAVKRLHSVYADGRAERPNAKGEAILAVLILDKEGRPIDEDPALVASFGWGVPVALAGGLDGLARWTDVEADFNKALAERIRVEDENGAARPLTRAMIDAAHRWLVGTLGLTDDLVKPPRFAIRSLVSFKSAEPPEPLLVNSFYLRDLARARDLFGRGQASGVLQRYMGAIRPAQRPDLFTDRAALAAAVTPGLYPPARWPGRGRHPLVLLQQAAVNLALVEGEAGGVLAVNGPPGTGKTTLLRDLLAALVTARAEAMMAFADPADAFHTTGKTLKAGAGWLHLYRLDDSLKGFEMLVASSNNGAVENVSAELPGLGAVAEDAGDLRYFKSLADALLQRPTWGLGAAVLGNAGNRHRFGRTFWWDKEVGLATYLAAAAGKPQLIEADADGPERIPRIVAEENAPRDHAEALRRWAAARRVFAAALERSRAALAELEVTRIAATRLPRLRTSLAAWAGMADRRPGFWSRLLRTRPFRVWREATRAAQAAAELDLIAARPVLKPELAGALARVLGRLVPVAAELELARSGLERVTATAEQRRRDLGERFVDADFFARDHAVRQKISPWLDAGAQRARDDVFVAAMALHKAFIDAAARPLRHNLGAMMNILGGSGLGDPEKDKLIPDLWASLFLVVPALSTTFASVDRMMGALPPASLGWLLIDEAGQALPQAAVGALTRARRVVVVGDPVQIPPVVTLPESLTASIHRRFGVDPDPFNAPGASVQTLADAATPYRAEFIGKTGSRTVGVPLLVHRRCAEPMFAVSNLVAYERMMVQAKTPEASPIAKVLGPSRWIDVQGSANDKWSPEEGAAVMGLLADLVKAKVGLDLYVVTPFVAVADGLRRMIVETGVLAGAVGDPQGWARDRVGTVHTVQGREAEAVIFVLGAPLPQQQGARAWAGGQPNLLNVAVTRAKEALYVVGWKARWRTAGVFAVLADRLD
ncbi:DEAD/DEAH box helicase [Caulobacter soli]|uniref:DEAD/DEAH box helicase n=1 Tax=Caulobacter soli TaxID=2708539 RepID=UPI0013EDDF00|nr:ATP-binding protein [Caulobacter soli]